MNFASTVNAQISLYINCTHMKRKSKLNVWHKWSSGRKLWRWASMNGNGHLCPPTLITSHNVSLNSILYRHISTRKEFQYDTMQYNTLQYNLIQYNTMMLHYPRRGVKTAPSCTQDKCKLNVARAKNIYISNSPHDNTAHTTSTCNKDCQGTSHMTTKPSRSNTWLVITTIFGQTCAIYSEIILFIFSLHKQFILNRLWLPH